MNELTQDFLQWVGILIAIASGIFAVGKRDQQITDMAKHLGRVEGMAQRALDQGQVQEVALADVKATTIMTYDLVKQIHERLGRT